MIKSTIEEIPLNPENADHRTKRWTTGACKGLIAQFLKPVRNIRGDPVAGAVDAVVLYSPNNLFEAGTLNVFFTPNDPSWENFYGKITLEVTRED